MKMGKVRLRQIILEELQHALDEGGWDHVRDDGAGWASAKEAPPRSPEPKQASAIRKIAHALLDTGLDPNDASVWEMVKDATERAGGMFPRAEGLEEAASWDKEALKKKYPGDRAKHALIDKEHNYGMSLDDVMKKLRRTGASTRRNQGRFGY